MNESRQQLRNRLELLEDIRCWLLDRIDGSEETKGDDGLISDFIRKLDALSSEMGTTPSDPAAGTPRTDAAEVAMMRLDGDEDVVVAAFFARQLERELIDLKQRLLPQFQGRTQRAEHERDGMLEKLIVHQTTIANLHDVIDGMRNAPSATGEPVDHGYDRSASLNAGHYVCTCGACSHYTTREQP